jgi:glutathione synthase/RimK-type ligase-like ATP-grasp enzyme
MKEKLLVKYSKSKYLIKLLVEHWRLDKGCRLLFSKSDWEPSLRRFERFTKHEYHFQEFSKETDFSGFDFVFPLETHDYDVVRTKLELNSTIIAPKPSVFDLCQNKDRLSAKLEGTTLSRVLAVPDGGLPLIAKPCVGINSEGIIMLLVLFRIVNLAR